MTTQNQKINELLNRLAPPDPINQDEMGGCVWCGGTPPGERYGYSERYLSDHDHDCAWLQARLFLNDTLYTSRIN